MPHKIAVNLVVLNGEKYIRYCLEALENQTLLHDQIEINILDNGSTDGTIDIITNYELRIKDRGFAKFNFVKSKLNFGMWNGQEELLKQIATPYVVFLSVDVIMDKDFLRNALAIMDANPDLGAIQAKVFQFNILKLLTSHFSPPTSQLIDTCGFKIFRSRRISNIGHGEKDNGPTFAEVSAGKQFDFNIGQEIFGVEGAVPVFRKSALESIRVSNEITDHDLFWYGEDLDVAWRLRLAGWSQRYEPSLIAWHDRGTTKSHAQGSWFKYIQRVNIRRQIPIRKRRLEWRNTRWTRIKNDYIINILKDLPYIIWREIEVLGYVILFEPQVLAEIPAFLKKIPRMLRKRREILARAKVTSDQIHSFFT